ncbi:hypothetical protein ACIA5D_00120 [Actinoplanes sp. NPDC051513]|uniref:hypothetical protein n=1 Tax=Actinoplanes sp. NPDC051513 TaxID=3363908 RepID=UPI0037881E7B
MSLSPTSAQPEPPSTENEPHRLELLEVDLLGGGRRVEFRPGLNIIQGDITTGKTTLVRLIRAMLGTMPKNLAPEVDYIKAIRGRLLLGSQGWQVYRPRTTTNDALVEVSEEYPDRDHESVSLRLPATGSDRSYSLFLLDRLALPAVSVPRARTDPTGALSPVTMTDWLGYCVVPGDELDTEVFGHRRDWRDAKRRWVFELAYGYYDPALALLTAKLRSVELQLAALEQNALIREKFLADTPFADVTALEQQLDVDQTQLERVLAQRRQLSSDANAVPGVQELRQTLLAARAQRAQVAERINRIDAQITDLNDLHRQLSAQSARLTRAIVADEWLVDFDFVVCPRCGNDVNPGRTEPHLCYLCGQQPKPAPSRTQMLAEQERVASQITETAAVITGRRASYDQLRSEAARLDTLIGELAEDLNQRTAVFVSDRATRLEHHAAEQARIEGDIKRIREYLDLLRRHAAQLQGRDELEAQRDDLTAQINSREISQVDAEGNVQALEQRMLEYLTELHIPDLGQELSVHLNRTTYLPEVSGRTFDELSSQGLKTLVNIAHALAHHTVTIDRRLPMPGLLVLDGLSANAGHEGFDQERVRDVYRLLNTVAQQYRGRLQIIAVDNEIARDLLLEFVQHVVLTLTQADRLIRVRQPAEDDTPNQN